MSLPVGNELEGAGNRVPGSPSARAGEYRRSDGQRLRQESPMRSFASRITHERPRLARWYPTASPAWPPPTITVSKRSVSCVTVISFLLLGSADDRTARRGAPLRPFPPTRPKAIVVISDHGDGSDEVVLERERARRGPGRHSERGEDVLDVPGDRVLADDERLGYLPVALAGGEKTEDLHLARRESVRALPGARRGGVQPGEVGGGPERSEHVAGRLELERRGVLVAERAARLRDEESSPRRVVRRAQVLPRLPGTPQGDECGARLSVSELDGSTGVRDERGEHRALVAPGDLLELVAAGARLLFLAGGQHDLHVGGQEVRAPQRLCLLAQCAPNRGCGRGAPALGESEERHARLRLPAEPARLSVRVLRLLELASQTMDLSLAVEGLGGRGPVETLREAFPGAACLLERVPPVPVELHDLRPVHEAAAGEGDEIRLLLAPAGQDRGPLLRPADLVRLLAGEDHAAVDDARRDRRHLPARDGHHGLVQESNALLDAAGPHQHGALRLKRERGPLRVAEPLGQGCRLACDGGRRREVAARFVLEDERNEQVAALDGVVLADELVGAPEPAAGRTPLPAQRVIDAHPERAPERGGVVARLQRGMMSALQEAQVLVVPAEHVGGRREELEVLGPERSRLVGVRERLVGVLPGAPLVRGAAPLQVVLRNALLLHHACPEAPGAYFTSELSRPTRGDCGRRV